MYSFLRYFIERLPMVYSALVQHIKIAGMAVALAVLIGVPLGIFIKRSEKLSKVVLSIAGAFQTIPSLALFGLIIPFLGIGVVPAVFVLFLYSLLPIITNTYIGIKGVDVSTIQAAVGMGMTNFQVLTKVKLPIAIAVIMGGVRISTVATIGTTTIAALIGAGGLGELIFRGISTSNNNLVLTGAIPTALLAFFVNYVLGIFEKALTPAAMLSNKKDKKKNMMIAKGIALASLALLGFSGLKHVTTKNQPVIVIGHKNFLEQRILGQMLAILIEENTEHKTKIIELGGSNIVFKALESSEIHLYPEYTGTAYSSYLGRNERMGVDEIFDLVKNELGSTYGMDVLDPLGFENTFALALKKETVEKYGIKTISDLSRYSRNMSLCGTHEFMEREDGLLGINKTYGMEFKNILSMDHGLAINALVSDKAEVAVVFSTDGLIAKHDLVVLEDDRRFFPPYESVVILNREKIKDYPEVIELLNKLSGTFTMKDMQKLNLAGIESEEKLSEIARKFLIEKKLIE